MSLVLPGATSGSVTIDVPAVAGTNALTLPASTGTLALTSQIPTVVAGPTFSAYQNTAQTISQNVQTKITFDSIEWNIGSNYSTSTSKFTPTTAGYYQVVASVGSQNVAGSVVELAIFKNGSTYKSGLSINAGATYRSQMTCMVYMNGSTDYIETYWYQNYSGTRATVNTSNDTYFQATFIKAA